MQCYYCNLIELSPQNNVKFKQKHVQKQYDSSVQFHFYLYRKNLPIYDVFSCKLEFTAPAFFLLVFLMNLVTICLDDVFAYS